VSALPGMVDALNDRFFRQGSRFLVICVGLVLLARVGREFGNHAGLGWIGGEVVKIMPADPALKIPHMGWNDLCVVRPHPLLTGIASGDQVYFVHSFALRPADSGDLLAVTDYGGTLTATIGRDNIVGTQFHPEKSQAAGLKLLTNFLNWAP
jgi:glutamine amidotransferase